MKKLLSLIFFAAAAASAYDVCPICDTPIADGKKLCNKCQEESDRNTAAMANAWMTGIANTQAKQQAVDKAASKLAAILSHDGIADSKKIEMADAMLKQINAPEFYKTIAAHAPLAVVKHYWPDPKDEKVYLASKKVSESRQEVNIADAVQFMRAQMGTVKLDAPKKAKTAFALGRSKKGNLIRYVDPENFSYAILAAAIEENHADVVRYFLGQTDGFDWEMRTECIAALMRQRQRELQEKVRCEKKLAEAEKQLKNAEDKYDKEKYTKQIAELKKTLAAIPETFVMEDEKGKIVFGDVTRFELYMLERDSYGLTTTFGMTDTEMREEAVRDIRNCAAKYGSPAVAKWVAKPDRNSILGAEKKYKWLRRDDNSMMTSLGQSVLDLPGCILCNNKEVEWGIGIPNPSRPGYVSAKGKGEFVWQEGIPDVGRIGFISAAKEGEWKAAPGFRKSGDKMEWVPGAKHPEISGVIAGQTPCSWIPDDKHLWNNPDNPADLSVREDGSALVEILRNSQRQQQ